MKYSTRALISVFWLLIYNLLATYAPANHQSDVLQVLHIGITYAPMLLALLVWFEQPKILYKSMEKHGK